MDTTVRRLTLTLVLLAILAIGVFGGVASALGLTVTGPATFSARTPADGSSVGVVRPPISVKAYDVKGLAGSPYYSMKVDGLAQTATFSRTDANNITLSFTPRADMANGTHTVYVSVKNNAGVYSTTTWSFTVSRAPLPSAPSPIPGSTVNLTNPVVSVTVGGATAGLTSVVLLDGTAVPATFNAGTGVLSAPTSGLANDASHDVTVTVTNSSGNSATLAWSFSVQIYADMPTPASGCVACHPGFPDAHPMANCLSCHGPGSPVGEGWNTPDYGPHAASYIAQDANSCVTCHTSGYATVPPLHSMTSGATSHNSAGACSPCHVKSLTTEHYRYGKTCFTCHASTNPLVAAAVATGRTDCEACHPNAASHTTVHETPVAASCAGAGCHTGSGLTEVHAKSTCDTCHKSTDERVIAAIAGSVKTCDACHSTASHEAQHATAVTPTCAGAGCHVGTSLTGIHINADGKYSCATCHKSTDADVIAAIAANDKSCTACHDAAGHGPAHDAAVSAGCAGAGCHAGTNLTTIHTGTCASCHSSNDPRVTTAIAANDKSCTACHDAATAHGDLAGIHTATLGTLTEISYHWGTMATSETCVSCHASDNLVTLHASDCSICHAGSAPRASFTTWSKGCQQGACHPAIHQEVDHQYDTDCSWCHAADGSLPCTDCHSNGPDTSAPGTWMSPSGPLLVGTTTITLNASDDSGPHGVKATYYRLDSGPVVTGTQLQLTAPASGSANHVLEYWSTDWSANTETIHVAPLTISADTLPPVTTSDAKTTYNGPAVVHLTVTDNATVQGGCTTYWTVDGGAASTGVVATVPQPASGSASHTLRFWSVDRVGNTETPTAVTFTMTADTVAPSTTVVVPHYWNPNGGGFINFSVTDPAPSSGIANLSVGITGGSVTYKYPVSGTNNLSWRVGVNASVEGPQSLAYWAVDSAGNEGSHIATSVVIDLTPPSTTSDAVSDYVGNATIHFTATDTYSPIAGTKYALSSNPGALSGSSFTVPAPATGAVPYYAWYYSGDAAGNWESSTKQNVQFTVWAAGTPTLTYAAGANGSVTGKLYQPVLSGGSGTAVTAVATTGYHFVRWSDGITTATRTDTNVTSSKTLTATFGLDGAYTLTYTAGAGGTISGTSPQTVNYNASGTAVTAVANSGYHFVNWSDGIATATRTDTNVTADKSVTANFAVNVVNYTLTYTAGAGGTISGTTPQTVASGGSGTAVTAVANTGYHFVSWSDGIATAARTDTNVTADKSVTANFAVNVVNYTLTYTAGAGGTISGTTPQTVASGGSGTAVTAVANTGYHFVSWSDGIATAARTDSNVVANKSVTANFAVNVVNYTLTYSAGGGGTVSGTTPQTVASGGTGTAVTAVANSGYHFVSWSDGLATASRTDSNVTANKSVTANFAANVVNYTLTYSAGANGAITGVSPQTVAAAGSGTSVTAVANPGYHFLKWSDNSTANPRTDTNVNSNVSVIASFEADAINAASYSAIGADQSFTVPAGVTALHVDLYGSQGGNGGGLGGRVQATLAVSPGQVLTVRVGDTGGWPNGGAGTPWGGAGGGSSSILLGASVIAEAGGGGGYAGGSPNQAGPGGYIGSDPGGNSSGDDAWQEGWGAGGGGGWNGGGNGGGDDTSGDGGTSRVPTDPLAILIAGAREGSGSVAITW